MHPSTADSTGNRNVALTWEATTAGTYNINGTFKKDSSPTTDNYDGVDVSIWVSGNASYEFMHCLGSPNESKDFSLTLSLEAGDQVHFLVNPKSSSDNDGTFLRGVIRRGSILPAIWLLL